MMQTTTLGRTGLTVSVAGLGCGGKSRLGQSQGCSFEHSVDLVKLALDEGVTFIDTAAAYGTEEIVGAAIRGRRDGVVISTKVGVSPHGAPTSEVIAPDALEEGVDGCLKRLGTDRIDVLHLHGVAADQYDHARTTLLERMERMREAGKIRFTGLTERFARDTAHEMATRATADGAFDVIMLGLNYVNQTALHAVLPAAGRNGMGSLAMFAVRGPLARRETAVALLWKLVERGEVDPATFDADDPLGFLIAPGVASSLTEAAYRFCRHAPGMDVTITGTGSREHLRANLAAIAAGPLPDHVLARLSRIFGGVTSESAEP